MPSRHWPIALVLLVQVGILVYIPAGHVSVRASGKDVTLRTTPIDPYDILSGYYATLAYEVERQALDRLPRELERGESVWLSLEPGDPVWTLGGVSLEQPASGIFVPARYDGWSLRIVGAGRLYVPEKRRREAEELARSSEQPGIVDLRVGGDGTVAVLRLRVAGQVFGE